MVCWLTVPAVLAQSLRVQVEGSLSRWGNSLRRWKDVMPVHAFTTSAARSLGHTRTTRGRGSGCIASASTSHPCSAHLPSINSRQRAATDPTNTGLRRRGHQIRWEMMRWTRCASRW